MLLFSYQLPSFIGLNSPSPPPNGKVKYKLHRRETCGELLYEQPLKGIILPVVWTGG
jgi:hypothetical protein